MRLRLLRVALLILGFVLGYLLGMLIQSLSPWEHDVVEGQSKPRSQVIHELSSSEPVVTLVDPERDDPYQFRWVVIVAVGGAFSIVVDRERGRLYLCLGQARLDAVSYANGHAEIRLGECVEVYAGVVVPKGRSKP